MKINVKSQKGITLIALTIAVIILVLLTGMLVYNAKDTIYIENYRNLSNDIENLKDKVSEFYSKYGEIPANIQYTNTIDIEGVLNTKEKENMDRFYVIDLQALDGLTLNFGEDYEKVKDTNTETANQYTDIYIIHKITHNIFYVEGVNVEDNGVMLTYYTTYREPDNTDIDLRYVEGVKIPNNFYYVGGTKETGLVISDIRGDDMENSKKGNQYVWIPVEDTVLQEDGKTIATDEKEFVESANANRGFYVSRFEAGIDGATGLNTTGLNNGQVPNEEWIGWQGGSIVSQKDAKPFNYITVKSAMKQAETMYTGGNVTGRLMSKSAYEQILRFINKKDDVDYKTWGNTKDSSFSIDSSNAMVFNTSSKNYTSKTGTKQANQVNVLTSGASNQNMIKNIYDIAGNLAEFTTYEPTEGNIQYVGSSASLVGTDIESNNTLKTANYDMGFRIVLYLPIEEEKFSQTYTETTSYTDVNGDTAYIPAGFQVGLANGINQVRNGLVIQDEKGNQFVWVPVDDINDFKTYEGYRGGSLEDLLNLTQEPYQNGYASEVDEYKAMYDSVSKNKGFYVGRYESGTDNTRTASSGITDEVKVAKGKNAYNYIGWSNSTDMTNENGGAVELSKKFAQNNRYDDSVTSTLIYGVQWDSIMAWIDPAYKTESCDNETSYVANSNERGNYSNNIKVTGSDDKYRVKNIYDMAGNTSEWTMEAYNNDFRTHRGGNFTNVFTNINNTFPASTRVKDSRSTLNMKNRTVSFRITLYVK